MAAGLQLITREAVDAALGEFVTLGREAFLAKYGFAPARDYVVQDPLTGTWADSKAIVGAAYGVRFPDRGPLKPSEFSGGVALVVRLLRELEFNVASLGELASAQEQGARGWSRAEVELLVADYLKMLGWELAGQPFNKAALRRALRPLLNGRSEPSIEFKHRNVSAVMIELGYPTVRGYLPAPNYQGILMDVAEQQLTGRADIDGLARSFTEKPAVIPDAHEFEGVAVTVPTRRERQVREPTQPAFRPVRRDYLELEARNRSLGQAGELFIVQYEQWRLSTAGFGQLADKVRHVALEDGDGLGYDVLSFRDDGTERFIEVKTTALSELTPFFVTQNEVAFARKEADRYALCRLFDFRSSPRFFELPGPIEQRCRLDPSTYRASLI